MEAAGLVLGIIPVAIEVLETYNNIYSFLKYAKLDLDSLIRDLTTEHMILRNTCEILLGGIVPDSALEAMIKNPGVDWAAYDNEVRLRLWGSWDIFLEYIEDIREATSLLREKLAVHQSGMTNASDHRFDITELKQKAFFGLKKKDYKKVLNRLKSANAVLSTLVHQSNELEGGRRSRARTKHSRLIRKLSKGIFTSFQNVVKCSCSHQLGLRMIARKGLSFPTDDDQLAASRIPFDVGFGSGEENPCQHWNILRVQSTAWDKRLLAVPTTKGVTGSPRSKSPKGVRWLSDLIEQTPKVALPVESQKSYSEIADICGMLRKGKSTALAADHPCGQISYDSTKFNLYQEENWSKDLPPLNLRAMLEGQSNRTSLTNWTGRVQAALALSYGILHLYNTPWLADIVTAEDIVFMREQQRGIEEPFLAKHLSSTTTNANQPRPMHPNGRSMNFVIFSLGLLLIQIMIGRYVHELTIPLDMCMESSIKKKEIATKYICLVVENGGDNYAAVVQWCLGSMFSVACLDDDEFVQDFHHHVIEKLERDLDIVLSRGSLI